MYLNRLSYDKRKAFLSIAVSLVNSDGDFSEDEQTTLREYCGELLIPFEDVFTTSGKSLDVPADFLNNTCSEEEKKIVVFELVGLAFADGEYRFKERTIIEIIAHKFCLSDDFLAYCEEFVVKLGELQREINTLLF